MKQLAAILFLLFAFLPSKAQNGVYFIPSDKETDSVRAVLPKVTNDSLKMLAWFYLSAYYTELNKDSALYYGILQRGLAQHLGQRLWESDACFQTAYLYFGLGNYPAALTAVTDGLAITDDASSEQGAWHMVTLAGDGNPRTARLYIAASLHQIFAFLYDNVGDVPNTVAQYGEAIHLAERVNNKEELSLDYMSLGTVYTGVNKLDSALLSEKFAYDNAIQSGYKIYLGFILNSTGTIYYLGGKYPEAASYYHRALLASREQKNRKDEIDALLFWRN